MKAQTKARPRSYRSADEGLIVSLSRIIEETLAPVLGGAKSCALVDYPNHDNVGDNAIWLGEKAYLRANRVAFSYVCDERTYQRERLAAELRRHPGPLLIHGGGSLGDLWPGPQRFRERVIEDFPDTAIVQLPQSIHFQNRVSLDRARRVFDSHPNLVLLVRDRSSLEIARREFQAASYLCPDMAFALGALNRPAHRKEQILWLSRTDLESVHESPSFVDPRIEVMDWLKLPPPTRSEPLPLAASGLYRLRKTQRRIPRSLRMLADRTLPWSFGTLARRRFARGLEMIGSGEVVVTDRLHGHILSLLMGIPHVLLDNNYGKMSGFYETWTKGSEKCSLVNSTKEAWERARELLQNHAGKNLP